jgi:hypothetical protein
MVKNHDFSSLGFFLFPDPKAVHLRGTSNFARPVAGLGCTGRSSSAQMKQGWKVEELEVCGAISPRDEYPLMLCRGYGGLMGIVMDL